MLGDQHDTGATEDLGATGEPGATEDPDSTNGTDRWRVAAVALLNLTGLGLGYALMRRWRGAALCWLATGILLIVALPAEPSGVPGGVLITYSIFLALGALHGALRARRTPLAWPRNSTVAAALAAVMLAVPAGALALYGQAHAEAVQRMLLGRLAQADHLVAATKGRSFDAAEPDYRTALATYRDLLDNDPDSRAGRLVPNRLAAFYQTVAAPYAAHEYCEAIAPLTYLRTLSRTVGKRDLGSLAAWPDDRLATSLYQCGTSALGSTSTDTTTATDDLKELLATFPGSPQATKVDPAVASAITKAAGGIGGSDPCGATETLRTLGTQAAALSLHKDAATAAGGVESGTYACGVAEYKRGDFKDAESTMDDFTSTYPDDPNDAMAGKFSIAAQIAQQDADAGKTLPTSASGGSVSLTILNDSPDPIEILYTGPATGSVDIAACDSCSSYPTDEDGQQYACTNSGASYPQATISLPPGTTYFLHENSDDSGSDTNEFSEKYEAGNSYTDCAYETDEFSGVGTT